MQIESAMRQRLNLPSPCLFFTGKTSQHAGDFWKKSLLVRGLSGMLLRCQYDVFPHSSMLPLQQPLQL